jgi:hypothetical protein
MKNKLFIALLLSVFFFAPSMAQNASINIKMAGVTKASCEVWVSDPPLKKSDFRKGYKDVPLKEQNSATEVFELKQPKFISMIFEPQKPEGKPIFYRFFLTPGDHLSVNIDFSKTANAIEVFGKGSNNNQPEIGTMKEPDIHSFYGDTLPNRVIATIIRQEVLNKKTVHDYILKYKPSAEFIKAWNLNLNYEAPETYYAFKENNKHGKNRSAFLRNANKWQKIQDSLFYSISSEKQSPIVLNKEINSRISMLNNQNALMSIYYTRLIESFLLREKESLWLESNNNPKSFYKDWYNTDDVAEGKKQFDDDQQTLLKEKIINKFFSGAPAEYLYIVLLEDAINESNPKNVAIIFDRFKQRYPKSRYIEWFSPDVSEIVKKQQQTLNSKMIFVENNGKKLNTLDEVLALAKGKTVLVDMW